MSNFQLSIIVFLLMIVANLYLIRTNLESRLCELSKLLRSYINESSSRIAEIQKQLDQKKDK